MDRFSANAFLGQNRLEVLMMSSAVSLLHSYDADPGPLSGSVNVGAIVYGIAVNLNAWRAGRGAMQENHRVVIFANTRQRNIEILDRVPDNWSLIGIARYIKDIDRLESRIEQRFFDDPEMVAGFEELAESSMKNDPLLAALTKGSKYSARDFALLAKM
jgi:hypothetical protein